MESIRKVRDIIQHYSGVHLSFKIYTLLPTTPSKNETAMILEVAAKLVSDKKAITMAMITNAISAFKELGLVSNNCRLDMSDTITKLADIDTTTLVSREDKIWSAISK